MGLEADGVLVAIMWHTPPQPVDGQGNGERDPNEIEKYLHLLWIVTEERSKEKAGRGEWDSCSCAEQAKIQRAMEIWDDEGSEEFSSGQDCNRAGTRGLPLSELERKMLHFSETDGLCRISQM